MDKKQKKILFVVAVIFFLPFLFPIFFYIGNFHELSISDNPEKWGPFGDFFGGVLNTYLSLLTLIVTVFIAYEISRLDDKRNEKVLAFEKQRFLNELRETEYRRITGELQKISYVIAETRDIKNEIFQITIYLTHFTISNDHLFPFLNEKVTNDLIGSLKNLYTFYSGKSNEKNKMELFKQYSKAMNEFTAEMQKFIMDEL